VLGRVTGVVVESPAGREALHVARVLRMALGSRPGY